MPALVLGKLRTGGWKLLFVRIKHFSQRAGSRPSYRLGWLHGTIAWRPISPMAAGIVCVGGDGIFHETFNGILEARAAAAASSEPGAAELAALLGGLRLAHIPAGSTDAVACTLHGSRSPWTAAMHVCLGDSCPLDVLRVDTASTTKFASCIAGEWA